MNIEMFFESLTDSEKISLFRVVNDYKLRIDDVSIASNILEEGIDEITSKIEHIGVIDKDEAITYIKK